MILPTPADLRRAVLALHPAGPLHLRLDAGLYGGRPAPWYADQRGHWLGWLAEGKAAEHEVARVGPERPVVTPSASP